MARQQWMFPVIVVLAIISGWYSFTTPPKLGLDLRGGSQLTLQVMPSGEIKQVTREQLEAVKEVLDRRINGLGVAESTFQTVGDDQLMLQMPDTQDPSEAARVLGKTALLEFRAQRPGTAEEMRNALKLKNLVKALIAQRRPVIGEDGSVTPAPTPAENLDDSTIEAELKRLGVSVPANASSLRKLELLLEAIERRIADLYEPATLTGRDLTSASRQPDQTGNSWNVGLGFNQPGGEAFARLTQSIAGTDRLLGIILDGRSISDASVGPEFKPAGITGGGATITGRFTADEARELEVQLAGGKLPLPIKVIEQRTVGPSLGAENIRRSLSAALAGLALVAVFMVVVYRLPGIASVVALALYALFNLSAYSAVGVTLTLPGIAGFILSIGMAVDANVLIFERIKEELRSGNTLIRSIDTGFSLAFSSILDGHVTGLISCLALFTLGTGLVKGFAVTLAIGLLLSLFTALTCTRALLRLLMSYAPLRRTVYFLPESQRPAVQG